MKKAANHIIPTLAALCLILFNSCSHTGNDDYLQAAQEAINGRSNVGGYTHFKSARSAGANGIVIGNHFFY